MSAPKPELPPFTPNPANDKVVFIRGWTEDKLKKILEVFKKTYEPEGYPPYSFELARLAEDRFRLHFPEDIHPQLLIFLINFIHYPFDIDFAGRAILAVAQSTLGNGFEGWDPEFGRRGILYVPKDDEDFTTVHMETEKGVSLAISFTDLKWKKVDDPRLPAKIMELIAAP